MKFNSAYSARVPDTDLVFDEPSLTKQSDAEAADINNIMRNAMRSGLFENANSLQGEYGDFTDVQDYGTSLNQVLAAQESFMSLPAVMRREFDNDPSKFFEFVSDPSNKPKMAEMGLLSEEAVNALHTASTAAAVSGQAPEGSAQA